MGLGKGKIHCTVGKQTGSEKGLHLGWGERAGFIACFFCYGVCLWHGYILPQGKDRIAKVEQKTEFTQ